jgi:hypothetical protein
MAFSILFVWQKFINKYLIAFNFILYLIKNNTFSRIALKKGKHCVWFVLITSVFSYISVVSEVKYKTYLKLFTSYSCRLGYGE